MELSGEAYFEVAKLKAEGVKMPFIVASTGQEIEVLGTHFNVNEYPDVQSTINIYGLYHSNKSASAGIGFKVLDAFQISRAYNSGSDGFSGGTLGSSFELGLRFFTSKR